MPSISVPEESTREEFRAGGRGEGGSQWRGGERSEPPRNEEPPSPRQSRETEKQTAPTKTKNNNIPDPEVSEKPVRRKFSAKYKREILKETDAATKPGQIGAILRREGLYSSNLLAWRRQREKAIGQGLAAKKRGRKPKKDHRDEQIKRLQGQNAQLKQRFEEAKLIIEIQKKTSQLLGIKLTDVSEHEKILREEENE